MIDVRVVRRSPESWSLIEIFLEVDYHIGFIFQFILNDLHLLLQRLDLGVFIVISELQIIVLPFQRSLILFQLLHFLLLFLDNFSPIRQFFLLTTDLLHCFSIAGIQLHNFTLQLSDLGLQLHNLLLLIVALLLESRYLVVISLLQLDRGSYYRLLVLDLAPQRIYFAGKFCD